MPRECCIVWLRSDLRLADNPALLAAVARGVPVIPLFIFSPDEDHPWSPGAASRWWLHHSLENLAAALGKKGSRLVVRRGPVLQTLRTLVEQTGARFIVWSRSNEPAAAARDAKRSAALSEDGVTVSEVRGNLLFEPADIRNASGGPFQVFTAFWRSCLSARRPEPPRPAPRRIPAPERWPESLSVSDLGLLPTVDWAGELAKSWRPGEEGASLAFRRFLRTALAEYGHGRDILGRAGTSRLSPHLHFGEISARQVWYGVLAEARHPAHSSPARQTFLREIGWREFGCHLLHHFPQSPSRPLRSRFNDFPWRRDPRGLRAWQRGRTGYPIVDAGMRELWRTGWLHNRARMITASFLVKHLLIRWQEGAAWYWDTLVDADLANNTLGWQWSAGSGADAAPYFRIFNPVLQGRKFDATGEYVRRWVPELAALPAKWIHQPWNAPPAVLAAAGIELGTTYPWPIVDHALARERALTAFKTL